MPNKIYQDLLKKVPKETGKLVRHSVDIANNIVRILDEKNITQRKFAELLGKEESQISKWLSGTHNFTLKTISKIETVLDTDILRIGEVKTVNEQLIQNIGMWATVQAAIYRQHAELNESGVTFLVNKIPIYHRENIYRSHFQRRPKTEYNLLQSTELMLNDDTFATNRIQVDKGIQGSFFASCVISSIDTVKLNTLKGATVIYDSTKEKIDLNSLIETNSDYKWVLENPKQVTA